MLTSNFRRHARKAPDYGLLLANHAAYAYIAGVMDDYSNDLLRWIDQEQLGLIDFLCRLIRAKTPNPPGHTAAACQLVAELLDAHRIPYQMLKVPRILLRACA